MTYVVLPVSKATYEEIARQVSLRGQPDRVDTRRKHVNLSDVVIELNEEAMMKGDEDAGG